MASSSSSLSASIFLCFLLFFVCMTNAMKEKKTHLHFYYHEKYSGPNATAIVVASQKAPSTGFGNIWVLDDELRVGPEPESKLIGRVQGMVAQASQDGRSWAFTVNFVFTEGKFNGSTLAVIAHRTDPAKASEWSIVGGSGVFRLAKGYAFGEIVGLTSTVLLIEFNAHVLHY